MRPDAGDVALRAMPTASDTQLFDPIVPSERFTVRDDRRATLDQVLAAANRCE